MLKSSLCDYTGACILDKGTITVPKTGAREAPNNRNEEIIFTNCAPLIDCRKKINNILVNNAKDIDVVIPIYNLIGYSDNYQKSIWKCMAML